MKLQQRTVPISDIKVTCRRKYLGDLDGLTALIREHDLWRPLLVNSDSELLEGERILECLRRLEWTEVPVWIFDGLSPEFVKLFANEFSKKLAPSEKVELVEKISENENTNHILHGESGQFVNKIKDLHQNTNGRRHGDDGQFVAETDPRKAVLEKLSIDHNEYYRAALVCREGIPELVLKMDEGALSVRAAADIAREPKDRQRELLELEPGERLEEVKRLRDKKRPQAKSYRERVSSPEQRLKVMLRCREELDVDDDVIATWTRQDHSEFNQGIRLLIGDAQAALAKSEAATPSKGKTAPAEGGPGKAGAGA